MRVKKTWFSYILWLLFSCSLAVLFYFSLSSYLNLLGIKDLRQSGGIVAICAVVLVTLFCLAEWFFNRKSNRGKEEREKLYTIIGLVLLVILFVLFRILLFSAMDVDTLFSSELVKNSAIQQGKVFTFRAFSVEDLFSSLLTGCFLLLGNKGIAVWILQMLLQTLGFVFSYLGVKRIVGRIPALTVCLGIAVLPMFFDDVISAQMTSLKLCIAAVTIWIISFYKGIISSKKAREVFLILLSFYLGILCYYDDVFCSFLLLPIIICIETSIKNVLRKILNIALWLIFSILGYGIMAFGSVLWTESNLFTYMEDYFIHRYAIDFKPLLIVNFSEMNYLFIVFAFCICYIIMFLKTDYDEAHLFTFIVLIAFMFLIVFSPKDTLSYYYVLAICFLTIAGAGVRNLVLSNEECVVSKEKDEENIMTEAAPETKSEIKFIENPLPLPKKHEKKEMEYGIEPEEDKMHFDYELTDNNAFYDV